MYNEVGSKYIMNNKYGYKKAYCNYLSTDEKQIRMIERTLIQQGYFQVANISHGVSFRHYFT